MIDLDINKEFIYNKELYSGYSIGKIILDLRTDKVDIEVMYHQQHKKSCKRLIFTFNGEGHVDVEDLLDKIYKKHF